MADVELVIKVPEESYNFLKSGYFIDDGTRSGKTILQHFCRAIYNGKPLPKGHGELIDRSKLSICPIDITDLPQDKCLMVYLADDVDNAEVIIEPDKESEG